MRAQDEALRECSRRQAGARCFVPKAQSRVMRYAIRGATLFMRSGAGAGLQSEASAECPPLYAAVTGGKNGRAERSVQHVYITSSGGYVQRQKRKR